VKKLVLIFFPLLLPLAVSWAREQEKRIRQTGVPLSTQGLADAKTVGVAYPDRIRLLQVTQVPMPENALLQRVGKATGLVSPHTAGMAIGYGIFIRTDCLENRRLIAHECVHTSQYERLGGIRPFLEHYLRECLEIGYPAAPMEQEAVEGEGKIGG
jgi:hypothetical protein